MPENSASTTPKCLSLYISFTSISLSQHPPPRPLHISLFLTEIKLPLLVKSLMKLDMLDDTQPWPSAQMITAQTNNPYYNHSSLYLFRSFSFLYSLFPLYPSLLLYFLSLFHLVPYMLNFRKIYSQFVEVLFPIKNEILLNSLSVLVYPLFHWQLNVKTDNFECYCYWGEWEAKTDPSLTGVAYYKTGKSTNWNRIPLVHLPSQLGL